jgi:ActR/RegA family two-component response regulator
MMEPAEAAAAATALVVSKDALASKLIINGLRPLAIGAELCEEVFAAARLLDKQKFEAVIVDLQLGEGAMLVMEQLRFSRSNRTAVTFAIATGDAARAPVKLDSTFVLPRPLSADSINQILRASYGLVVRERRRYFRCPLAVPAFVRARQPEEEFLCQTVNISEGGVAINARAMLDPALSTAVRFSLPDRSSQLFSETRVRWRGQEGLVGLEFLSLAATQKSELQEWLARKLDETLPENVAALFRSVGQV